MNDEENAFRFINRIKAAIEDYEAGRMTYKQLLVYVRGTAAHF